MCKYLLDFKICNNILFENKSKFGWEFEKEQTAVNKVCLISLIFGKSK